MEKYKLLLLYESFSVAWIEMVSMGRIILCKPDVLFVFILFIRYFLLN